MKVECEIYHEDCFPNNMERHQLVVKPTQEVWVLKYLQTLFQNVQGIDIVQ